MNKKKETKVLCPQCGAEFAIPKNELTTMATIVGKDSGLGTIYPAVTGQDMPTKPTKKAQERIAALRNVGVDVSCLFAMQGADGGDYVVSNKNGKLAILDDNDPIFEQIITQGTVPNRRLFRRWIMAQLFHMMTYTPSRSKKPLGVTTMIHRLGYEYQWKMVIDELYTQMKMEGRDLENFIDRNRWFNTKVVADMADDYIKKLKKRIDAQRERRCKGIPYKRVSGRNIFVSDLKSKLYLPLHLAAAHIRQAKDAAQLYTYTQNFNDARIRMARNTPQSNAWVDAFKGSGAFFTMQNLIRFHGCMAVDDTEKRLDKYQSLAFLSAKAEGYKNGEGWRLLATLKKMLNDNNINIKKKMAEWRKNKK